jgi:hypothetical protein
VDVVETATAEKMISADEQATQEAVRLEACRGIITMTAKPLVVIFKRHSTPLTQILCGTAAIA